MAVFQGSSTGLWNTMPISGWGAVTSVPDTRIDPDDFGISPASSLSRVDLPHPDGPTMVMKPPLGTSTEMGPSACTIVPSCVA